jgi:hypothetical protein
MSTPGTPSWAGERSDGSMLVESVRLIVREVMRSTGSSVPSTVTPSTDEVPVSRGVPLTHRPVASARSARRLTRSPLKVGSSERATARMSIVPTPGTVCGPGRALRSGGGIGIGSPAIASEPSPAAALAVCADGVPVAGSRPVVALSSVPVTGSGVAGKFPPACAALQAGAPRFAVTGSVFGLGPSVTARALDSQAQPCAEAEAGSARINRKKATTGTAARHGPG